MRGYPLVYLISAEAAYDQIPWQLLNTGSYYNYVVIHYIKTQTQVTYENGKGVSLVWQVTKIFFGHTVPKGLTAGNLCISNGMGEGRVWIGKVVP